jgi:hypothetical protein
MRRSFISGAALSTVTTFILYCMQGTHLNSEVWYRVAVPPLQRKRNLFSEGTVFICTCMLGCMVQGSIVCASGILSGGMFGCVYSDVVCCERSLSEADAEVEAAGVGGGATRPVVAWRGPLGCCPW